MNLTKYVREVGVATDYPKFAGEESVLVRIKATDLFLAQYVNGEFNAFDVVVKYLAVENFYGINDYGFELYRKMQFKRVNHVWEERFRELIYSMEENINMNSFLELDLNYSIHDGAHRLALALYHNYDYLSVKIFNVQAYRRYYGIEWFKENGFSKSEIQLILNKFKELLEKCCKPYYCLIWTPARNYYQSIENAIGNIEEGVHVVRGYSITLRADDFKRFIYDVYETDDILKYKLDLKYEHILQSLEHDQYESKSYSVYVIELKIDNPDFRLKPLSALPQSRATMRIKRKIRDTFKAMITDYYYDIIMHLTDNQIQNDAVESIISRI